MIYLQDNNYFYYIQYLVLKLNSLVYVTGFTLEHIPKSLAPNGRIDSAPRNFTVWVSFQNSKLFYLTLTLIENFNNFLYKEKNLKISVSNEIFEKFL